jgi:hAT family protein
LIYSTYICKQESDNGDFGNISVGKNVPKRSEIDTYLSLAVENVKDPLKWWFNNRQAYPNLSRMARDYLSIPGKLATLSKIIINYLYTATSTAVERVFSQGRHLLYFTRNRLTPRSIRAHLCLGSWARHDMLRWEDLLAAMTSKRKREHSLSSDDK